MTDFQHDVDFVNLAPDTTIGHYRIVSKVGSGGMGDVYKAYDTQLERNVALKVLRPELLHDREKVSRFIQEAKAASALNHPAIVTIYEVATATERGSAVQYIAMEFVDGVSLREYFDGKVALPKLLAVIIQVAEGMSKAHAAGVVHRDLKPDNIVMTAEGAPKIVDFGLAKLMQPDLFAPAEADGGATLRLVESKAGTVMGTVGYMSPEQVEARPVDHRSDVFSLGCILYEAVAGRSPFPGTSVVGVLHQILTAEPAPVSAVNPAAPAGLDRIVRRCLAKDPDERYQSIKEVAIELRAVLDGHETPTRRRRWNRAWTAAAAIAAVAAIGAAIVFVELANRSRPSELTNYRFTPFATDAAYEGFPAWSPDGKSIAYVEEADGILQVFVRAIDGGPGTQITHAMRDCREPFWDPRGNRIFYVSLAQDRDSLWSVSVGGGAPEVFLESVSTAAISPDRRTLATLRETGEPDDFALTLWISSPPEAPPRKYDQPPLAARRFVTGYLRFTPDSSKFAMWSADRATPDSPSARQIWLVPRNGEPPQRVLQSVTPAPRPYPFSWMPDGRRIVFGAEYLFPTPGMHLWTGDTTTNVLRPLTRTGGSEYYPSVSPDGKRIVFSTEEDDFDLIRVSIDGSPPTPFLATSRSEKDPVWSPTNDEYAYVTNRSGSAEIWVASGNGQWQRPLVTAKDFEGDRTFLLSNLSFSPDGRRLAYQRRGVFNYRVWISPVAGGAPVAVSTNPRHYEDRPTWSPDGNWLAFTDDSEGRGGEFRLVKIRLGSGSPPVMVKQGTVYPSHCRWSPRGDWITVDTPDGFSIVSPDGKQTRVLSEQPLIVHAWSKDGSKIYGIRMDESLHLVLASIDIATLRETVISDLGPSAPMVDPVEGFSIAPDGKSFLTSMPHLTGDLWIVDGFAEPQAGVSRFWRP